MKPKLRALEVTPTFHDGEEIYLIADRQGFAQTAGVPRELGGLLALFDGRRDAAGIVGEYSRRHGQELPLEFVEGMIEQFDDALFLDSPRFQEYQENEIREFENARVRPATLAGASYPSQPEKLTKMLDGFFDDARRIETEPLPENAAVRGVVVPHIDFNRGGITEALAYQQLLESDFDTFIVLGIAHAGVRYPFCGANKDFQTPLGTCRCDEEFLNDLQSCVGEKLLAEQYAHKSEHSIEFVAVFLQHLDKFKNAQIVPIICGGFFGELKSQTSPWSTPEIVEFIQALREVVKIHEAKGKRIGLIASVDLAHVGSRFGDEAVLTPARLQDIRLQDSQFLQCIEEGDAEKMHAALAKDNNARNVDAHPAAYIFLAAFPELRAQLLDYRQAFDEEANSVVSFASMTLYS